jgi:hypothetical protein
MKIYLQFVPPTPLFFPISFRSHLHTLFSMPQRLSMNDKKIFNGNTMIHLVGKKAGINIRKYWHLVMHPTGFNPLR